MPPAITAILLEPHQAPSIITLIPSDLDETHKEAVLHHLGPGQPRLQWRAIFEPGAPAQRYLFWRSDADRSVEVFPLDNAIASAIAREPVWGPAIISRVSTPPHRWPAAPDLA